jgi:hypothetical protein
LSQLPTKYECFFLSLNVLLQFFILGRLPLLFDLLHFVAPPFVVAGRDEGGRMLGMLAVVIGDDISGAFSTPLSASFPLLGRLHFAVFVGVVVGHFRAFPHAV